MPRIVKPKSITWTEVVKRTLKEGNEDDILGRSAQLSYYFFLALIPFLICMLALLGMFSSGGEHVRLELMDFLGRVLPASASQLVQKTLGEVSQSHERTRMSLGLLFSLWSASAGMSAIMDTLNAEHEVEESRSFIKRNLISVGLTVVTGLLLLLAAAIVVAGGSVATAFAGGMVSLLLKIVAWPVAIALMLFVFAMIYFFAPDVKDQKWHWVTPGATAGLVLWLLASVGFKIYLHFFNTYTSTYGSLGAVMILLLWFYITGVALLTGSEINTVIEDAAAEEGAPDAKMKGEKAPDEPDPKRAEPVAAREADRARRASAARLNQRPNIGERLH